MVKLWLTACDRPSEAEPPDPRDPPRAGESTAGAEPAPQAGGAIGWLVIAGACLAHEAAGTL